MDEIKSVAEWMRVRKVTFEELLQTSHLERKILDAILNGRYTPSPQQRQCVANALQVRPEQVQWGHTAVTDSLAGHGPQFGRTP